MTYEDLTGKTFGYLTVVKLKRADHKGTSWICKCVCGKEVVLGRSHLVGNSSRSPSRSCGCKHASRGGKTFKYPRIYSIWKQMLNRCYNPKADNYDRYGGKGVTVSAEWREDFTPFLEWALNSGYDEKLTLDRVDSSKPYSPNNCRWADYFTQEANRGLNKNNTTGYKGVTYSENKGYRAYLMRKGIRKYLGFYNTLEEAVQAREKAEKQYEETGSF